MITYKRLEGRLRINRLIEDPPPPPARFPYVELVGQLFVDRGHTSNRRSFSIWQERAVKVSDGRGALKLWLQFDTLSRAGILGEFLD